MGELMIKKVKNTAILNDDVKPVHKAQVLEIPNSDYINAGKLNIEELGKYNLKSITIVKGRNTVVEIIKEA
jgi:hypothetical protein